MWLPCPILFRHSDTGIASSGLPHSAICGSQDMCSSPQLFAAYHGLLRLVAPRHPPYTFIRLTILSFRLKSLSRVASRSSSCRKQGTFCFDSLPLDKSPISLAPSTFSHAFTPLSGASPSRFVFRKLPFSFPSLMYVKYRFALRTKLL